jgi:hypothetical protein
VRRAVSSSPMRAPPAIRGSAAADGRAAAARRTPLEVVEKSLTGPCDRCRVKAHSSGFAAQVNRSGWPLTTRSLLKMPGPVGAAISVAAPEAADRQRARWL